MIHVRNPCLDVSVICLTTEYFEFITTSLHGVFVCVVTILFILLLFIVFDSVLPIIPQPPSLQCIPVRLGETYPFLTHLSTYYLPFVETHIPPPLCNLFLKVLFLYQSFSRTDQTLFRTLKSPNFIEFYSLFPRSFIPCLH